MIQMYDKYLFHEKLKAIENNKMQTKTIKNKTEKKQKKNP